MTDNHRLQTEFTQDQQALFDSLEERKERAVRNKKVTDLLQQLDDNLQAHAKGRLERLGQAQALEEQAQQLRLEAASLAGGMAAIRNLMAGVKGLADPVGPAVPSSGDGNLD